MERGRDDVLLAHGDNPAILEACQDIDAFAGGFDDRRADEDGVDRPVAKDRNGQLDLERIELAPEGVALHRHVQQRQDRLLAALDRLRQHDHSRARPEQRRASSGQVEDRFAQAPAQDQVAHRGAFAARQDQPADAVQVRGQAHLDALHADRGEGVEMLPEGALQRQNPDFQ